MDNYMNYGQAQQATPNWNGGQNSYISGFQNGVNPMNQFNNGMGQTNAQQRQVPSMVQRPTIPGRLVNSINEVAPGEVPMDGNPTYFPTADGEVIHACYWTREGKIETVNYIRQKADLNDKTVTVIPNDEAFQTIMSRLDEMQKEIKRISRPRKRNFTQSNALEEKTEVTQNG